MAYLDDVVRRGEPVSKETAKRAVKKTAKPNTLKGKVTKQSEGVVQARNTYVAKIKIGGMNILKLVANAYGLKLTKTRVMDSQIWATITNYADLKEDVTKLELISKNLSSLSNKNFTIYLSGNSLRIRFGA